MSEIHTTLTAAFSDLNVNGAGGVTFNIEAGHTENTTLPIAVSDNLHIYPGNDDELRQTMVYDVTGKLLHSQKVSAQGQFIHINTASWKKGIYFIRVVKNKINVYRQNIVRP